MTLRPRVGFEPAPGKGDIMRKLMVLAALAALTACGSGLEGTYRDETGMMTYTFKSDGTMYQTVMGTEMEVPYEMDGEKILIGGPEGRMVMTLLDDGSIQGPMGMKLTKRE